MNLRRGVLGGVSRAWIFPALPSRCFPSLETRRPKDNRTGQPPPVRLWQPEAVCLQLAGRCAFPGAVTRKLPLFPFAGLNLIRFHGSRINGLSLASFDGQHSDKMCASISGEI
ncbi:hypothetical protein KAM356_03840 [Aeromonas caviae]|nr:hypothetical protein KAM356_03840 [Aeromonas caviae]GJB05671.1 hypothetical protein KAM361_03440 [Aeromonas caviae]GJB14319.1 hypothetical protein KAM363_03240 [Aeromonas caviae]